MEVGQLECEINAGKGVIVYFQSPMCGVCKLLREKITVVLEKYPEIKILDINLKESPELGALLGVYVAPLFVLYIGGKEYLRKNQNGSTALFENELDRLKRMGAFDD
ncbi:thioredoxin family protein [Aureibacter tunicatorum]|uniref:Thiol-disulfide isomerase/thioredoxin n=1 Tax=Aureibacter tunicatorum TaxID=866807 RepID=A0AAE3XNB2_9BACT|nr:thioredoxin family protein [Aureibacter tunicatorum]MDR6239660.1 thiol-disulfide isomerase/thioredoxin [Aureibacter tunicatorum]BDD04136.1 hypothetical protein AUTU_16190 [Aureibacter tunicatorum]